MKEIYQGEDAIKKILIGINKTADAVKSTLGPRGQNVFIEEAIGRMIITKDGVTVANNIVLEDKLEEIGSSIVKDAASKTNTEAGDGTTTASLLTQFLANEGNRYKAIGFNSNEMQKGMTDMLAKVEDKLKEKAKTIKTKDEMKAVAMISSNGDEEISEVVSEVLSTTGKDGVISIEKFDGRGIKNETVKGMQIENGFIHPFMINDYEKQRVNFDNPAILLITDDIQVPAEINGAIEKILEKGYKQVVLVSPEISGDILGFLVRNKQNGKLQSVGIKAPSFGDNMKRQMEDLAKVLDCKLIGKDYGITIQEISKKDFSEDIESYIGNCETLTADYYNTIISGAKGDVESYVNFLKDRMNEEEDLFNKEKLKERIGKLTGGVAVIKVGGDSLKEQKEKHYRVEDAVMATKAAIEEGIVAGAGTTLLRVQSELETTSNATESYKAGEKLVLDALAEPLRQLARNAGKSEDLILEKVKAGKDSFGYNSRDDKFEDMYDAKIIDPLKVARLSLRYAVSTVKLLLSTNVVLVEKPEDKKE